MSQITIKFNPENHCEAWLWFVDPDGYRIVRHYVAPLLEHLLFYKDGEFKNDYPILKAALEHCDRINDVILLRIMLFHFIAFDSEVRGWAINLNFQPNIKKQPILPLKCESECIYAIRNLCRQYAELKITGKVLDERIFFVVTTGCKTIGDTDWIMPEIDPEKNKLLYRDSYSGITEEEIVDMLMTTMSERKRERKIKGVRRALSEDAKKTKRKKKKKEDLDHLIDDANE